MAPATVPGMGARPYPDGVAFRVWAPFAGAVHVGGEFNDWSPTAHPLTHEGGGYWSTDVAGAAIGQQYRYLISRGGETLWRNDPYARELAGANGNSVVHDPDFDWETTPFTMPSWNELVVYELHIGTFNDEPTPGPGKFQGVIDKLPYLRDLGINAVEVMAAGEFDKDISWGYNPAYIFAIESSYGGLEGFKGFVKAAHDHGIAVLFDVVYNHLGHPSLDMWRFDGWSQPSNRDAYEPDSGGIYFYSDARAGTPWGCTRLDYGRGEVRQFLRDNALNWLEARRVDGLRWDATAWIRNARGRNDDPGSDIPEGWSLMQWINDEIKARQPWKICIAEDLQGNAWLTKPTGAGGAGFDAQWDAGFVHSIRHAVIEAQDGGRDMVAVRDALAGLNAGAFQRVVYTESHDEDANGHSRVAEEIWPGNAGSYFSQKRATLGTALVCTAPGIPMLFQGQEFLEDGFFSDTRALDWSKARRNAGLVDLHRDLIRLRRNWFDSTAGLRGEHIHVHHVNNADKVIAFHRWEDGGPGDDVVVVANMANRGYDGYTVGFPRPGLWRVRFNSDWRGYSPDFGDHPSNDATAFPGSHDDMPCHGEVGLGPYSVVILSQDRR